MSRDWWSLDRAVERAVARVRHARRALAAGEPVPDPFDPSLLEQREDIAPESDPLARAIARWLEALEKERACWRAHAEVAARWREKHPLAELGESLSPRQLRQRMMATDDAALAARHAEALARIAEPLSDAAIARLEQRAEARLAPAEPASELAARLLAKSADAAAEAQRRGWIEGVRAALGRGAVEGWPAHLTHRWLEEVLAPSGLLDGLRIQAPPLPSAWGATSFARALGRVGVAAQIAARPAGLPFALHQPPFHLRPHTRFALFASIVGEPAFARRVLALGKDRARHHVRLLAAAFVCSLRLEALAVLARAALKDGKRAAQEAWRERGEEVFGEPPPAALLAVLPQLDDRHDRALHGALAAAAEREELVGRFDEDWFHNPRAGAALGERDALPPAEPPDEPAVGASLERLDSLVGELERRIG